MSLHRKMFRGTLWCTLDGWASELANLAIFLVMVRLLGPEEFGLVALALVFTTVATDLFGYSISQVLVQRPEISKGLCDTVFWLAAGLTGLLGVVLMTAAPALAAMFDQAELAPLLRWLCLAAVLQSAASVPLALLTRGLRFDVIAKRSLLMTAGGATVGITLALDGAGTYALVGLQLTQAVISALILFTAARFRPGFSATMDHLRAIRGYVSGVIGNRVVGLFDERAAQFVIGLVIGPAAVGYYNVAMRLVDILIRMFVVPVNQVAMPAIATVQNDPAAVRGILASGIGIASLVSVPAFLGTAVIAPVLVPIALGQAWLPTIGVLQILALRGLVWPMILYGQSLLYGIGQPAAMLRINLIDLALNVLTLPLATPFGLAAVAAASTLRVLLIRWPLIGRAIAAATGLGLVRQASLCRRALLAGGVMAVLLLALRAFLLPLLDGGPLLLTLIGTGAAIYLAVVLISHRGLAGAGLALARRLLRSYRGAAPAAAPAGLIQRAAR